MSDNTLSTGDRVVKLFDRLGIRQAHVAACMSGDWGQFVTTNKAYVASLTIAAPHLNKGTPRGIERFDVPSLVIAGDQGAPAKLAEDLVGKLTASELFSLQDYSSPMWADTVADRRADVARRLIDFLRRTQQDANLPDVSLESPEGVICGVRYRSSGSGPPLVLFPLSLAPSQWSALIDELAKDFCVINLGGANVGAVSLLEARAKSGYGKLLAELVGQVGIREGEHVLDVGCGTGALSRYIGRQTNGQNAIIATDLNPYLLSEAKLLASSGGLSSALTFQDANAEALPFADASFDVSFSCTVMEEGDANRMMSELARVTRPGGRIACVTRATDLAWWVNAPMTSEDRNTLAAFGPQTGAGVGDGGCASADLYARLTAVGLSLETFGPRFAFYRDGERLNDVLDRLAAAFSPPKMKQFREAVDLAVAEGTISIGEPFHCAITKR